ncbi:MAG: MATE family efflux transporter [Prevotellaceae bacterium]|nr:MATE family efflux transporter [Prevotellaceae bacterium]
MNLIGYIKDYLPFYRRNLIVAIPVVLSQLGQGVVILADSIMVGSLGTNELAAASFANAIILVGYLFVLGISFGATPVIGKHYSGGKHREAAVLFQNSILLDMLILLIVGAGLYVTSFYLDRMGQDTAVCELAAPYYRWLLYSLPPLFLFQSFKQFMEGIGDTKYAMMITLFSDALNIVLNYLLIFGKLGFPEMGMVGAGVATFLARLTMPILYLCVFFMRPSLMRYFYFFRVKVFSLSRLKNLGSIGIPIGFQMLIESVTFSLSAVMVGWFGAASLSSHQVAMNLSSITFMMVSGISSATTIRVSHQLGSHDYVSMQKAGFASMHLCSCFNFVCALLFILFRYQIPLAFSSDPEVVELSATLLIMAALYQIADGLQVVTLGALRGMSDVKAPMRVAVFCYLVVNLPVGYLLGVVLEMGAVGIWIGFIVGLNLAAVLLIRRFIKTSSKIMADNR